MADSRRESGVSLSPTVLQTRFRQASVGFVFGDVESRATFSDSDKDGGLWTSIFQSAYATRIKNYLCKRARNDYILCCVPKKNPWRKRTKALVNSRWFNWLISLLIVIHCFILAFYKPYVKMDHNDDNKIFLYLTILFELLYIIEAGLRITAAGLIMHPYSYLRYPTNIIDVIVIIICFVFLTQPNNQYFETLSAVVSFKLIRVMIQFKAIRFLFRALLSSLLPLLYLAWMTTCVALFFALIGVEVFHGALHYACYVDYINDTGLIERYQLNEFPCDHDDMWTESHRCEEGSYNGRGYCYNWESGPHNGLVGFDNIFTALLTVFQCITLEGWTSVLYLYESVYGVSFVWLYFIMLIGFGSIFMLNLLLGVLTTVFVGVSDQQEAEGHLRELKEKQKIKEDLEGYRRWLKKGFMSEDKATRMTRSRSLQRQLNRYGSTEPNLSDSDQDSDIEEDEEITVVNKKQSKLQSFIKLNNKLRSFVSHVIKSNVFFWFMIVITFMNFVLLAADYYNALYTWSLAIKTINYLFTVIYIIEFVLKFYSQGLRTYFASKFNRFDILFTFVNVVDILVLAHIEEVYFNVSAVVNACRAIRLVSIFRYSRYWEDIKAIIATFSGISLVIFSVFILLNSWLVVSALFGMRLFGTWLTALNDEYHPSFDTFYSAYLLVFQLATTEDWHRVMYRTAESISKVDNANLWRAVIAIYYVIVIVIGGFIIVSIFLAIAIDKLSEVKSVKEESSQREEQREEKRRKRVEQLNALKNPVLQSTAGVGNTLRSVLLFYSSNLEQQEQQRKKQHRNRRLTETHVKTERSISLQPSITSTESRRSSYAAMRTMSDTTHNATSEERHHSLFEPIQLQKVLLENPLSKFFKSHRPSLAEQGSIEMKEIAKDDDSTTHKVNERSLSLSSIHSIEEDTSDRTIQQNDEDVTVVPDNVVVGNDYDRTVVDHNDVSIARLNNRQSSLEEIHEMPSPEDQLPKAKKRRERFKTLYLCTDKVGVVLRWLYQYLGTIEFDPRNELKEIPLHSSFFILAPENKLREWCYNIAKSRPFQTISITVTLLSSLVLALELPLPDNQPVVCTIQKTIFFLDIFFLIWFMLEFILKMISMGTFLHRGSYFRSVMNIFDFLLILSTLVPLIVCHSNTMGCLSYSQCFEDNALLTSIKVFRVLRPLRIIRIEGLYLVIRGLFTSLRQMVFMFFVAILVLLIFSIIGVQIFKGKFFYCSDFVTQNEEDCRGRYFIYPNNDLSCPQVLNREWKKWELHFDNIGHALLSLYTMITKEGWQDIMYHAIDSHVGPVYRLNYFVSSVYFVTFMVTVTFFLINLLVGSVIVSFQQFSTKYRKNYNLDRNQLNCLHFVLTSKPRKKYIPTFSFHKKLYTIIKSQVFHNIINVAILVNTIVLAINWYEISEDLIKAMYWTNFVFTCLFTIETVLKLAILTPAQYFRSMQRSLEFLITVTSWLEFILQLTLLQDNHRWEYSHLASAMRILRLIRISKKSKLIIWTILRSLEIFPWVGVLMIVILYTYALVGIQLFGQVYVYPIAESITHAIHQYNNFENFPQALLVMIRCFTGENWEQIMLSARTQNTCADQNITTCGSDASYFFFLSFMFLSNILVLNLFVAIIIDNFDYFVRDKAILGSHDLINFYPLWAKLDPSATGKLHHSDVIKIMRYVNPPLGWGKLCPHMICYRRMIQLNIPMDHEGYVTFNATLFSIVRRALRVDTCRGCKLQGQDAELREKLQIIFPNLNKKMLDNVLPERPEHTTGEEYAALFIQQFWRRWKLKIDKQMETKFPDQHQRVQVLRRVPDMGPELLQRRLTVFNLNLGSSLAVSPTQQLSFDQAAPTCDIQSIAAPVPPLSKKRTSFLTRLDVINESDADSSSNSSHGNHSPHLSPHLPANKRFSTISESELFATPTGSMKSLDQIEIISLEPLETTL